MIRLDRQDIRKEAEFIQANEGTKARRFSWGERFAAGVIVQLCDQLDEIEAEAAQDNAERQNLQSAMNREVGILNRIVDQRSPASIYWIDGERVMCAYCDFEDVLDADVVHDEKCPIVQMIKTLKGAKE